MSLEEALEEFVTESNEMLERLFVNLALFEKGSINDDALNSIYRDIHTIKGTAQLFGCSQIGETTHAMENVFSPIRDGEKELTSQIVDLFFEGLDIVKKLVEDIRNSGQESDCSNEIEILLPKIEALDHDNSQQPDIIENPQTSEILKAPPTSSPVSETTNISEGFGFFDDVPVNTPSKKAVEPVREAVNNIYEQSTPPAIIKTPQSAINPLNANVATSAQKNDVTTPKAAVPIKTAKKELKLANSEEPDSSDKKSTNTGNDTIRVQVHILDNLMNVVGELVLIRNLFMQFGQSLSNHEEFSNVSQRLNIVTSELQNEVMKTRMQPIGNILTKFHRVVRDISKALDKNIDLVLEGTETELDKTLIEAVKDPLTHIVRNSADHGLETPKDRIAAGKPSTGTIYIRSYHEGGQIVIEVEDNGKGLDREAIGRKSLEKGIISEETLSKMSEKEIQNLIFMPGFSTAAQVSTISGRGVGMDVVRTNIEKIGGVVDLESKSGQGTTIKLKIPLTLAIVPALIVSCQDKKYGIPQVKLEELVRIQDNENEPSKLEVLQGKPVYRLRERLLPLISLAETLSIEEFNLDKLRTKMREDGLNIVVLNADNEVFGLIVDTIEDSTDIVIKPLPNFLKTIGVYSGATVLGDGSVSLTLDVVGLAERANLQQTTSSTIQTNNHNNKNSDKSISHRLDYLVVEVGGSNNYVIPIAQVNRLEEFKRRDIQKSGNLEVISYGKQILPIIDVEKVLGLDSSNSSKSDDDPIFVVVVEKTNKLYGIKVKAISDVLELDGDIDSQVKDHDAVLGSILDNKNIIVVLDVYYMIRQITHDESPQQPSRLQQTKQKTHILLAEDTGFFRNYIKQILEENGYEVTATINGEEGYNCLRENPHSFDLIISDIEMPKMNGLQFAAKIRSESIYNHIPLIALSTKYHQKDQEKGFNAGFDCYLEKLNAEKLTKELSKILSGKRGMKIGA